jgi:hypothetical protein
MESKTGFTKVRRRRTVSRHAGYYRARSRVETPFRQPAHISLYLNPLLDGNGKVDRKRIVELFNTERYG